MAKKILIIDDDPMLRKMYSKKFEIAGFEIDNAKDGEEGIIKIQEFKPDLILMDVMMPRLDGFGVLEKLKANPELANIPVILLTNVGASEQDKEKGLKLGACEYLIKSQHSPNEIIEIVKKYLE